MVGLIQQELNKMVLMNKEEPYILIFSEIFGDFLPLRGKIHFEVGYFYCPYVPLENNSFSSFRLATKPGTITPSECIHLPNSIAAF